MDFLLDRPLLSLALLVVIGIAIAVSVANTRYPIVISILLPAPFSFVLSYPWKRGGGGLDDFSDLWPYFFAAFYLPTALSAVISSYRIRREKRAANPADSAQA